MKEYISSVKKECLEKIPKIDLMNFSKHIKIKGECIIWTGFVKRTKNPCFWSKEYKRQVYVRKFVLGLITDNLTTPIIRRKCKTKKCVRPSHLLVNPSIGGKLVYKSWPEESLLTLKKLLNNYPLAYLSQFYNIDKRILKRIKNEQM